VMVVLGSVHASSSSAMVIAADLAALGG